MSRRVIGTWDWDLRRNLLFFDNVSAGLFSVAVAEAAQGIEHTDVLARIHEEDGPKILDQMRCSTETGSNYAATFRVRCPDGGYRWIFGRGECQRDAYGRPVRFAGINVDLGDTLTASEIATAPIDLVVDLLAATRVAGEALGDPVVLHAIDLVLLHLTTKSGGPRPR